MVELEEGVVEHVCISMMRFAVANLVKPLTVIDIVSKCCSDRQLLASLNASYVLF